MIEVISKVVKYDRLSVRLSSMIEVISKVVKYDRGYQ